MFTSTLKWPLLATTASSFMSWKWFPSIACLPPVTVMNTSPSGAACSIVITRWPSITASSARTGLTSVTMTCDPIPRARMAMPRPHQP